MKITINPGDIPQTKKELLRQHGPECFVCGRKQALKPRIAKGIAGVIVVDSACIKNLSAEYQLIDEPPAR